MSLRQPHFKSILGDFCCDFEEIMKELERFELVETEAIYGVLEAFKKYVIMVNGEYPI